MVLKSAWLLALSLTVAVPAGAGPARAAVRDDAVGAVLLDSGAHRLAAFELARRLPALRGAERDQALYRLGQARRRMGDLSGAEEALSRIAAESAWFPKATAELADLYAIQGKTKRAIMAYQALIRTLPESEALPVRLRLGEELLATRDYEGAIDAFRPLQECDDPAMREAAWYGAGWAATRANLHSRAVWFWHQAIREFPTSARISEARLNLANHYLRMGKLAFAAEQLLAVGDRSDDTSADSVAATAEFVAAEAAVQAADWVRAIRHYKMAALAPRWAEASAYGIGYTLWQAGQLAEAEDAFEVCIAAYPTGRMRAAARYALGRVQHDRGRSGDARKAYLAVLSSGKGRWAEEALFQLAGLELAQDRPAEAMAWCRRLIGDYPTGRLATPGLWLLAESQLASGAISDAIESYGRLAKLPESLSFLEGRGDRVMYKLGLAYFKSGDLQSAEAAFRLVRPGVKPVGGEARFWRAEALYRLGRYPEAADLFEDVLAKHPDAGKTAEAAYGLGWAELRRGRRGPAMWAFKQAAEKLLDAPMKRDAYQRLALLQLDAGSYKEAQDALKQVLNLDEGGDPTEGAFYLAWSQMRAGDLEDASRGFAALADRSPQSQRGRQARNYQGQVLLRLGKFADAGRAFEALAAAGEWGEDVDPRIRAAGAYFSGGDPGKAAALYLAVSQDASASAMVKHQVLRPLVGAYLDAGQLGQAESVLLRAASGDSWVPASLIKVAEAYGKSGRWKEAAAAYSGVPSPEPATLLERARALRKGGDPNGAAEIYRELWAEPKLSAAVPLATVLFELFDSYDEAGRYEKLREVLERLERVPGADPERLAQAWYRFGDLAVKRGDPIQGEFAYRAGEKRAPKGSVLLMKIRYALGSVLVDIKHFEDAMFVLASVTSFKEPATGKDASSAAKESATAFRTWKALAWLKQGEALEKQRRWEEAQAIYTTVGNDSTLPERERQEAQARLAWIKANVKKAQQP